MKKFFSFAIALVACALAFTSCELKIDSPLVGSWNNSGKLTLIDASTGTSQSYDAHYWLSFFDNGQFQNNVYITGTFDGVYRKGTWSVKGDQVTIRKQVGGRIQNNNFYNDSSFEPTEEVATWSIKDHYLTLTYSDGHIEQYYDGSGQ